MPNDEREMLKARVPADLKVRVQEHAAERGLTVNAALIVLIEAGLRVERRRKS